VLRLSQYRPTLGHLAAPIEQIILAGARTRSRKAITIEVTRSRVTVVAAGAQREPALPDSQRPATCEQLHTDIHTCPILALCWKLPPCFGTFSGALLPA
jgi:hypothetical protein